MTASEHLVVLFSIVIGLGLTHFLSNLHRLLHPATHTKWHWLPVLWAANVFVSLVFWWWMMSFFGRLEDVPNIFGFVLILLGPVLLYLLAASVLPDVSPGDSVDLRQYYFQNHRRYFGIGALYTLLLWVQVPAFNWQVPVSQHAWAAWSVAAMVILQRASSIRVHATVSIIQAVLVTAALATYWFQVR